MRMIDAEALCAAILDEYVDIVKSDEVNSVIDSIYGMVINAPTVEARPQGKWEEHIFDGVMGARPSALVCTQCNRISLSRSNFCPNCGADMRGEEHEIANVVKYAPSADITVTEECQKFQETMDRVLLNAKRGWIPVTEGLPDDSAEQYERGEEV